MTRSMTESHPSFKKINKLVTMNHQLTNPQCWHNLAGTTVTRPDGEEEYVPNDGRSAEWQATKAEVHTALEQELEGGRFADLVNSREFKWGGKKKGKPAL